MSDIPELSGPNAEANKDASQVNIPVEPIKSDTEVVGGVLLGAIDHLDLDTARYNDMVDSGVAAALKFKPVQFKLPPLRSEAERLQHDVALGAPQYAAARASLGRRLAPLLAHRAKGPGASPEQQSALTTLIFERTLNARFREIIAPQVEQLALTRNLLQFQTGPGHTFMRQNLALGYRQLYSTNSLVTLTKAFAEMVENKLEAIKINTKLPDTKKLGLFGRAREAIVKEAMGQASKAALGAAKTFAVKKAAPALADYLAADTRPDLRVTERVSNAMKRSELLLRKTKFGASVLDAATPHAQAFASAAMPFINDMQTKASAFSQKHQLSERFHPDLLWQKSQTPRATLSKLLRSVSGHTEHGAAGTAAPTEAPHMYPSGGNAHDKPDIHITFKKELLEVVASRLDKIYDLLNQRLSAPVHANGLEAHERRRRAQFGPGSAGAGPGTGGGRFGLAAGVGGVGSHGGAAPENAHTGGWIDAAEEAGEIAAAGTAGSLLWRAAKATGRGLWQGAKWGGRRLAGAAGLGAAAAESAAANPWAVGGDPAATKAEKAGAASVVEKATTSPGVRSAVATGGRFLAKRSPLVGLALSGYDAFQRVREGDWLGAGAELAGGVVALAPGAGTAASVAIGGALVARDMNRRVDALTGNRGNLLAARMKVYGAELTMANADAIRALEARIYRIIQQKDSAIKYPELQDLAKQFGFDPKNAKGVEYFHRWIVGRFYQGFAAYLSILKQHGYTLEAEASIPADDVTKILAEYNQRGSLIAAQLKDFAPSPAAFTAAVTGPRAPGAALAIPAPLPAMLPQPGAPGAPPARDAAAPNPAPAVASGPAAPGAPPSTPGQPVVGTPNTDPSATGILGSAAGGVAGGWLASRLYRSGRQGLGNILHSIQSAPAAVADKFADIRGAALDASRTERGAQIVSTAKRVWSFGRRWMPIVSGLGDLAQGAGAAYEGDIPGAIAYAASGTASFVEKLDPAALLVFDAVRRAREMNQRVDALTGNRGNLLAARMKVYGAELTMANADAIRALEARNYQIVTKHDTPIKLAELRGIAKQFGFDPTNRKAIEYFNQWLTGRFGESFAAYNAILGRNRYSFDKEAAIPDADVEKILAEFNRTGTDIARRCKDFAPSLAAFQAAVADPGSSAAAPAIPAPLPAMLPHPNSPSPAGTQASGPAMHPAVSLQQSAPGAPGPVAPAVPPVPSPNPTSPAEPAPDSTGPLGWAASKLWSGVKAIGTAIIPSASAAEPPLDQQDSANPANRRDTIRAPGSPPAPLSTAISQSSSVVQASNNTYADEIQAHGEADRRTRTPAQAAPGAPPASTGFLSSLAQSVGGGLSAIGSGIASGASAVINAPAKALDWAANKAWSGAKTIGPAIAIAGKTFSEKASGIMQNLMKDFGLSKEQAAGVCGNLGHESGGFKQMQEKNPLGGGRGGLGWAQWTGPRRVAYEQYCNDNKLDPSSDTANYGYLKHELQTTYKGTIAAVKQTNSTGEAMQAFEKHYEAAGVKNYASRQNYADAALKGFGTTPAGSSDQPTTSEQTAPGSPPSTTMQPGVGVSAGANDNTAGLPTGSVGSGQCVDLVKQTTGLGHTSTWQRGDAVCGNPNLKPGTAIACFDSNGTYGNHTNGTSHAAIYLGPSTKYPGGIRVYDQWSGHGASERDIRPSGGTAVNNANAYSVIKTEAAPTGVVATSLAGGAPPATGSTPPTAGAAGGIGQTAAPPADNTPAQPGAVDTNVTAAAPVIPSQTNASIAVGPYQGNAPPPSSPAAASPPGGSVSAGPAQNILAPIRTATADVRAASSRDQTPPPPAATQAPSAPTAHPELLSNSKATVDLLTRLVSVSGDSHATLKDLHQTTQDAAKQAQQGLQDQQSNTGGAPTVLAPTINQVLGANNKDKPDDGLDVSKKREPRYAA